MRPVTAYERRAPVQGDRDHHPGSIPWHVHVTIWEAYAAIFGHDQSAERMAERGGFGYREAQLILIGWRFRGPYLGPELPPLEGFRCAINRTVESASTTRKRLQAGGPA